MKRFRLATLITAALVLAVLVFATGAFEAGTSVLLQDGHILTVEVDEDPYDPAVQGLVILDQSSSGTTSQPLISTWDPAIDQGPNITLNPYDGQPVLVWSRQVGSDFEIAMTRRLPNGSWASIDILTGNQTNDIEPRSIVDPSEVAHILWWPSGLGGPVLLGSFNVHTGQAVGPLQRPFESGGTGRKLNTSTSGGESVGGGEDPGTIGGLTKQASANPCLLNPAAAPDHGVVLGCGRPAAYQLSDCKLLVAVYDPSAASWGLTSTDLSGISLSGTSVREIVQTQVNVRCDR